jgi:hypothetical protein
VEEGRPVAVHHALGVSGGAARVAHGGGGGLLDRRPVEARALGGQQGFVAKRARERGGVSASGHDEVRDGLQLVGHPGQQRDERIVHDDDLVLRVIGHVDELLGKQPDVERVKNGAHARHGEVGLEVLLVVPAERGDAIPRLDPQPPQRAREAVGALRHLIVPGALHALVMERRNHAPRVHPAAVIEEHVDGERVVRHGAAHEPILPEGPWSGGIEGPYLTRNGFG